MASGLSPRREQRVLAIVVAVGVKVVGVLFITAMPIIPTAMARRFSRTPVTMALMAAIIGACASVAGLTFPYHFNSTTGPTIVWVVDFLFVVLNAVNIVIRRTGSQFRSN